MSIHELHNNTTTQETSHDIPPRFHTTSAPNIGSLIIHPHLSSTSTPEFGKEITDPKLCSTSLPQEPPLNRQLLK